MVLFPLNVFKYVDDVPADLCSPVNDHEMMTLAYHNGLVILFWWKKYVFFPLNPVTGLQALLVIPGCHGTHRPLDESRISVVKYLIEKLCIPGIE